MPPISPLELPSDHIVLLDGGTGSELRRRGVDIGGHAWSAAAGNENAALLREIHADYIRAGADVITTNTFATSRFVLEAAGLGEQFETLNRRTIAAAMEARTEAADRPVAIAGSLSCLPPRFDVAAYPDERREADAYRELAGLLAEGGVDLIALEMMQAPRHAALALEAALGTGLPVWLGVSVRLDACGELVAYDDAQVTFAALLDALLPMQPDAVNVMHSVPEAVCPALTALGRRWNGPLGAYPELESPAEPEALARLAPDWVSAGARLIGGCCGTTPAHIRALHALRRQLDAILRSTRNEN